MNEEFSEEEVHAGAVWLQDISDKEGDDYAKLVIDTTLTRLKISLEYQDEPDKAEELLKGELAGLCTSYSLKHPESLEAPQEFVDRLLKLSNEFVKIGNAITSRLAQAPASGLAH